MKPPLGQKEAITIYQKLASMAKKQPKSAKDFLEALSDKELTAFIAVTTYNYSRTWDESLNNAICHMKDRAQAIHLFSQRDKETIENV